MIVSGILLIAAGASLGCVVEALCVLAERYLD